MRRKDLDYARGIAILLILIGHSSNGMSEIEVKLIYSFHVPLFFVLSGMLLRYTKTADRSWLAIGSGWLKRMIIPSIIWELILSAFYLVIKDIPLKQLILNSITLHFNLSVLWFIPCLLLAETAWIAILKACKREATVYVCGISAAVFLAGSMIIPVLFLKRVLVAGVFIIFGYILEQIRGKNKNARPAYTWLTLIPACIIWLVSAMANGKVDLSAGVLGNVVLYYLHSLSGSLVIILACRYLPKKLPLLGWVGRNTMGFLVTHVFVRHAIIAVEEKILGYFLGGWFLAVPMILIDIDVVWLIGCVVPEGFGQKRLKAGVEKK